MKQTDTKYVVKHYFQTKTVVEQDDIRDMLTRIHDLEFKKTGHTERKLETSTSREDRKFMKIV